MKRRRLVKCESETPGGKEPIESSDRSSVYSVADLPVIGDQSPLQTHGPQVPSKLVDGPDSGQTLTFNAGISALPVKESTTGVENWL